MLALLGAEYANPSIVNLLRIHAEFHHDDHCEKAVPDRNGDMFSSGEFNPMRLKAKAQHSDTLSSHIKFRNQRKSACLLTIRNDTRYMCFYFI